MGKTSAIMAIVRRERAETLREAGLAVLDAVKVREDSMAAMLRGDIPARWMDGQRGDQFWEWLLEVPDGWLGRPAQEDVVFVGSAVWS